jgi:DNA-binding transcriptional ArsR family regulator
MNDSSTIHAKRRSRTAARPRSGRKAVPADPARRTAVTAETLRQRRTELLRRALDDHGQVDRLARMFRALGDPTRSRLVYALSLEELCVSELADLIGVSLSATSHQLRILRDLEIVRVRRQGKSQLYALNERAFGFCSPRSCQAWRSALETPERNSQNHV